jgi:hypothetical protein
MNTLFVGFDFSLHRQVIFRIPTYIEIAANTKNIRNYTPYFSPIVTSSQPEVRQIINKKADFRKFYIRGGEIRYAND